ncbi:chorismate-binding protein [Streptomyces smyrnaeus]|uniref:chorismate-binding protein n=1 Tax=Streptomyces smyrnaeus TaxID=1387713 RepID=UPI003F4C92A8
MDLLEKGRAENAVIVDLVRNDLGRVCAIGDGSGAVRPRTAPGLVHLVSTVRGELVEGGTVRSAGTLPSGSVTGAPKSSALRVVQALETAARGPYRGGIGWVDADRGTGELAVGIRIFWIDRFAPGGPALHFGTGARITCNLPRSGSGRIPNSRPSSAAPEGPGRSLTAPGVDPTLVLRFTQ